jgi:hypothetical protein
MIYYHKKTQTAQRGVVVESTAARASVAPRPMSAAESKQAAIEDYHASRNNGEITVPTEQSMRQRVWEAASNPMTAAKELYQKGRVDPNLEARIQAGGERNPLDMATDVINPVSWANYAGKIPGMVGKGDYGSAALETAAILPFLRPGKGAKNILKAMGGADRSHNASKLIKIMRPGTPGSASAKESLAQLKGGKGFGAKNTISKLDNRPGNTNMNLTNADGSPTIKESTLNDFLNEAPKSRSQKEILRNNPIFKDAVVKYKGDFANYKLHEGRMKIMGKKRDAMYRDIEHDYRTGKLTPAQYFKKNLTSVAHNTEPLRQRISPGFYEARDNMHKSRKELQELLGMSDDVGLDRMLTNQRNIPEPGSHLPFKNGGIFYKR